MSNKSQVDAAQLAALIALLEKKSSEESKQQAEEEEEQSNDNAMDNEEDVSNDNEDVFAKKKQLRIPVTVLTGFLGSGKILCNKLRCKTTLLNHILTSNDHRMRIVVIENEFGEVGIDEGLIKMKGEKGQAKAKPKDDKTSAADHTLVQEELIEMNNGCICCTVRGDLIGILRKIHKRHVKATADKKIDHVLIETTGLADPGPVAQTFFVDEFIATKYRLEGIVTLIDSYHVYQSLGHSKEALEQIAFADIILLNKLDLVEKNNLDINKLYEKIKSINATAQIHKTINSVIDPRKILRIGGFNIRNAITVDSQFFKAEQPFEYACSYNMKKGVKYSLVIPRGPDDSMKISIVNSKYTHVLSKDTAMEDDDTKNNNNNNNNNDNSAGNEINKLDKLVNSDIPVNINKQAEAALHLFTMNREFKNKKGNTKAKITPLESNKCTLVCGENLPIYANLDLTTEGKSEFYITPQEDGEYILYSEHQPVEYYKDATTNNNDNNSKLGWQIMNNNDNNVVPIVDVYCYKPSHEHDYSVSSVGIELSEPLNINKLNKFFDKLFRTKGTDLYRSKGILWIEGYERRYVFHAVHMLFNGVFDRYWEEEEPKKSQMVFIGKNLDRQELTNAFMECVQKI